MHVCGVNHMVEVGQTSVDVDRCLSTFGIEAMPASAPSRLDIEVVTLNTSTDSAMGFSDGTTVVEVGQRSQGFGVMSPEVMELPTHNNLTPGESGRIMISGIIGNAIDTFDFAIFVQMSSALGKAFFPKSSNIAQVLYSTSVAFINLLFTLFLADYCVLGCLCSGLHFPPCGCSGVWPLRGHFEPPAFAPNHHDRGDLAYISYRVPAHVRDRWHGGSNLAGYFAFSTGLFSSIR